MLLQKNCISDAVTNGLKHQREESDGRWGLDDQLEHIH